MEQEKNFAELVDESMNEPEQGKLFTGMVVRIDKEDVFIDFGSKSEGVAPTEEFFGKSGELEVEVGDEVELLAPPPVETPATELETSGPLVLGYGCTQLEAGPKSTKPPDSLWGDTIQPSRSSSWRSLYAGRKPLIAWNFPA